MGKIAQMCSEPVVSQHNDLKGMLVPGYSMVLSVQTSQEWFACIRMRPVIVNSPN